MNPLAAVVRHIVAYSVMKLVPSDPSKAFDALHVSLAKLRALAALQPNATAYLTVTAAIETAVMKLEKYVKKTP